MLLRLMWLALATLGSQQQQQQASQPEYIVIRVARRCILNSSGNSGAAGGVVHAEKSIDACVALCRTLGVASCQFFEHTAKRDSAGECRLLRHLPQVCNDVDAALHNVVPSVTYRYLGRDTPPTHTSETNVAVASTSGGSQQAQQASNQCRSELNCSSDCNAPTNRWSTGTASIVWPTRPLWFDPGVQQCVVPRGLDAGLCVAHSNLNVRCLPSFVIIGVQKGATREITNWLDVHPQLSSAGPELHFLNKITQPKIHQPKTTKRSRKTHKHKKITDDIEENASENGHFWRHYLDLFPKWKPTPTPTNMAGVNPYRRPPYYFEKTPKYVIMPTAQLRTLRQSFPNMKYIISLRNPVERLYSSFNMKCFDHDGWLNANVMEGPTSKANPTPILSFVGDHVSIVRKHLPCNPELFHKLFAANAKMSPQVRKYVALALQRGHYARQLSRWFEIFGRNHLHVLTMEVMLQNPILALQQIETFLGIDAHSWNTSTFEATSTGTQKMVGVDSKVSHLHRMTATLPMLNTSRTVLQAYYAIHNGKLKELLHQFGAAFPPWVS